MIKKIAILTGLIVLFLSSNTFGQAQAPVVIKGRITDATTSETMPFVNIVEIDSKGRFVVGTVSDANGTYVMKLRDPNDSIQVSFIGYKKSTFKIENRTKIDVALELESTSLQEVKIVANKMGNDGVTQVRDRGTAVTRLEMAEMKSVMSTTVEEMMQGRMGNVDITSVSGDPGAGLNIRIRGTASLNAKNNPLIVINGIPYNAEFDNSFDFGSADVQKFGNLIDVSPEDIESIEVQKDAASTAVWGSKASNGVIMIKTKRGIKSKPIFEFTYKSTMGFEGEPIPMLDDKNYVRLIKDEVLNATTFTDKPISLNQRDSRYFDQISLYPEIFNKKNNDLILNNDLGNYSNYSQNTNWVKEITQTAFTNQADFSVRGGGDKAKYNMSVGYFDEGGTTKGNRLKKLNLRTSLDYDLSTRLQFRSDIMFTRYDQDATYDVEDDDFNKGGKNLVRSIAYRKMPNMSIYDRDTTGKSHGKFFLPDENLQGGGSYDADNELFTYNPVAFVEKGVNNKIKDNARALFSIKYNIVPSLTLNSTVTLDIFDSKQEKFLPYEAIGPSNGALTNKAVNEYNKKSSIITQNQLIYKPDLGKDHEVVLMSQLDLQDDVNRWFKEETTNSPSPFVQQPFGDINLSWVGANITRYASTGLFCVANYKYKDKYIFMVGAKEEATSKFSSQSRWGLFPTTSLAWRVTGEDFMKNVRFINELKLRGSWGQSGNLPDKNDLYFRTYKAGSDFSYMDVTGTVAEKMGFTSIKWETIEQTNLGLDFTAFDNRLNLVFDVYKKKTLDLYLKDSGIPEASGYKNIDINDGEMENRGIEFQMDFTFIKTEDWQFDMNGNFSRNQNIVTSLPKNYELKVGDMLKNGNYKISIEPGVPLGGAFGYKYLGVYPTDADAVAKDNKGNPILDFDGYKMGMIMGTIDQYAFKGGDAIYKDVNYDGKIDELDLVYLGDLNPKYMGGGGFKLRYKKVSLNTFFNFKVGQKIINQTRMETEKMYNFDNQSKAANWRWRRPGDITDVPRALYNNGYNWLGSDRFIEDGSFLRLKTLSLSYNLPERASKSIGIKDMKFYVTLYNIYTWTKYSGQDPDVSPPSKPTELAKDYSRTPPSRRIMLGFNITF